MESRVAAGRHVEADKIREAVQHALNTWWAKMIELAQSGKPAMIVLCGPEGGRRLEAWMKIIGLIATAFYCHHPNRPQAMCQIQMGHFLSEQPIPFSGKASCACECERE